MIRHARSVFVALAAGVILAAGWLVRSRHGDDGGDATPPAKVAETRATPATARHPIVFDTLTVRGETADTSPVVLEWRFTNHGDIPAALETINESCGCLAGSLTAEVVPCGSGGTLRITAKPGTMRGLVRKPFQAVFVGYPPVNLVAEINILRAVEFSTQELVWHTGEQAVAKTVEISAGTAADFKITEVLGAGSEVKVALETLAPGRRYRLTVVPAGHPAAATHILQVLTDSADPRDRTTAVFVVTGASSATAARAPQPAAQPISP